MFDELKTAIDNDDLEGVKKIVISNPNILRETNKHNDMLFIYTCRCYWHEKIDKYEIIKFLLQYPDIDADRGLQIILFIFRRSSLESIDEEIERQNKLIEVIELLLKNDANINATFPSFYGTMVHELLKSLHNVHPKSFESFLKLMKILIKYEPDLNLENKYGWSSIDYLLKFCNTWGFNNNIDNIIKIVELFLANNLIDLDTLESKYGMIKIIFQYELEEKLKEKDNEILRLKQINEELRFRPGNDGYFEAMSNFNRLAESTKK